MNGEILAMPDYQKMYAVLCTAIDREIDTLKEIPLALASAKRLENALLEAEEIYIETSTYVESDDEKNVTFHVPDIVF